jgi:hypothetical protein
MNAPDRSLSSPFTQGLYFPASDNGVESGHPGADAGDVDPCLALRARDPTVGRGWKCFERLEESLWGYEDWQHEIHIEHHNRARFIRIDRLSGQMPINTVDVHDRRCALDAWNYRLSVRSRRAVRSPQGR